MSYSSAGNNRNANNDSGLNNRYNSSSPTSYQNSTSPSYRPPKVSGSFAQQQTQVMEDTMRTHYETEATSAAVLSQLRTQRGQLDGANTNVWEMRQAAERAKKDITSMAKKVRKKKMRLQMIVIVLAVVDFVLFVRLIQCGGSFYCKRRNYSNNNNSYYGTN
uniref:t-SNARE coiled-coil homology domain-containing protein n=1 Tax=Chaetoceros debilis TaxID=122233 RepID=A0A7S3QDT0_9STRA|mmetsp:Transcript_18772/g.28528  ORF Transcript_18772/g.28528 Transcript_18772/m.28528 type:complete len:162 (+) Transcript_18772:145-630(+)|eukprot:CAMPEP_0194085480 /NCGR_PEP_ID=MMETSP0149-20130528/17599_1 /TAXON_ID=122233 /ORGANISM="Chaetoceros debilis, Strain MM31A-1" /LENGTH=161 /DNA_ID=CAMNT_0038768371 /DNA_START=56 /DNA_END=541 /DNA_ORIENTATION=+